MKFIKWANGAPYWQNMRRFFVEPGNIGQKSIRIDSGDDLHHIRKVLRLDKGDIIQVSDGRRWEYSGEIIGIYDDGAEILILDKQKFAREPVTKVTLFQGVPKQGKMDLTVRKTTELGISTIVPVFMDRTVISDKGNFWKRLVRLRTIAEEAAKQCGRGIVPEIRQETDFTDMVSRLNKFQLVLFPYEEEEEKTIKFALRNQEKKPEKVAIIIGPEGGFSPREAEILKNAQTECVSLGKTILRTETAGIAALAMCMYELEL